MADKNDKADKAEKTEKSEPVIPPPPPAPKGFFNSAFWKSPFGTVLLIAAVAFVLPMDEIMEEIVTPGLGLADRARQLLMLRIQRAGRQVRKAASNLLWVALTVAVVSSAITIIGIANHIRVLAALGPAFWGIFLIYVMAKIRVSFGIVRFLTENGIDLSSSVIGMVMNRLGVSLQNMGLQLQTFGKKADNGVSTALKAMIAASFVAGSLLFLAPNWYSFGLFLASAIAIAATSSIASLLGENMEAGWRLVHRWTYRLIVAEVLYGLLLALLPKTMGRMPDHVTGLDKWLDAWMSNPSLPNFGAAAVLVAIALLAGTAYVLSAYHSKSDEGKSKAFAIGGKAMLIALPAVAVLMLFTGTMTWPGLKGATLKAYYGPEYTVPDGPTTPTSAITRFPAASTPTAPAGGKPNGLDPPDDPHMPSGLKAPAPSAPEADPVDTAKSLQDKSDIELLTE